MSEDEALQRDLQGGCHCSAVRFRIDRAAASSLRVVECNCSICMRKGFLHWFVEPAHFHLLSGSEVLTEYRFNTRQAVHRFCRVCGIHPFYSARSHPNHVDVNVRCLDDFAALRSSLKVEPFDGKNWEEHIDRLRASSR